MLLLLLLLVLVLVLVLLLLLLLLLLFLSLTRHHLQRLLQKCNKAMHFGSHLNQRLAQRMHVIAQLTK